MDTTERQEYLSYSEVQARYGIGRTLAWKLLSLGEIEGADAGVPGAKRRTVRIRAASVEDYLRRNSLAK